MTYDSEQDTSKHIRQVRGTLKQVIDDLVQRAWNHDRSKLETPEKELFDEFTPKLRATTYGSPEYKKYLEEMGEALKHHYKINSHHPEYYPNGIDGMSLMDLVEMFCDWKAATLRHADGDFRKSLEINKDRFGISDQLAQILENTRERLEW